MLMALYIASLNSGSNGNCYYVGNNEEAVLIDAGISCREIEKRMARLGLRMDRLKAIFISHEHSDHICGVEVISRKYSLPVYITPATMLHGRLRLGHVVDFTEHQCVQIGSLKITPFTKAHDAAHPHSFVVADHEVTIGVFTDLGVPCSNLISYFKRCHAAFLEANYDDAMLEAGRYPFFLKRRIRGGRGHLSNAQALQLFVEHRPSFMSHVLLSHLSKDNNSPELALELFRQHAGTVHVDVASRYAETMVYQVDGRMPQPIAVTIPAVAQTVQYSLFG